MKFSQIFLFNYKMDSNSNSSENIKVQQSTIKFVNDKIINNPQTNVTQEVNIYTSISSRWNFDSENIKNGNYKL